MRLPRTPKNRAGALTAAAAAAATLAALILSAPAGAHPGPTDTSGGHYCTQAQNASGLCAPPTYHRHDPNGDIRVTTPGPEAAQLTGQATDTTAQPFNPGGTPTTAAPAPTTAPPPPAAAPAAAPLPNTGPMDMRIAVFGSLLFALGVAAVTAQRRIPLPVVLELERRAAAS